MRLSGATMTAGFHRLTTQREEAIIAAMRNVYWLAKEDNNSFIKIQLFELVSKPSRLC